MNDIRAKFEEIWPVPERIEWSNESGEYEPPRYLSEHEWDHLCYLASEHNARLDTFTSCQEIIPAVSIKPVVWRVPISGEWFYGTKEQCLRERADYEKDFTAEDYDEEGPVVPEPLALIAKQKLEQIK